MGWQEGVATNALCPPRAHPAAEDHGAMAGLPQASLLRRRRGAGVRQDEHEEGRREPGRLQQAWGTAPSSPLHRPAMIPGRALCPLSIFPGAAGRDREGHKLGGLGWEDQAGHPGSAACCCPHGRAAALPHGSSSGPLAQPGYDSAGSPASPRHWPAAQNEESGRRGDGCSGDASSVWGGMDAPQAGGEGGC